MATASGIAKILYDFQKPGMLSLRKSDKFVVVLMKNKNGWWCGESASGERGMFPAEYVQELQSFPAAASGGGEGSEAAVHSSSLSTLTWHPPSVATTTHERRLSLELQPILIVPEKESPKQLGLAFALFDFEPITPTSLPLKRGDKIFKVKQLKMGAGWWHGCLDMEGKRCGYFPANFVALARYRAIVQNHFASQNAPFSVKKGDVVYVLESKQDLAGWLRIAFNGDIACIRETDVSRIDADDQVEEVLASP